MPWCGLGTWPTPLESSAPLAEATGLERLWVKREDRSAVAGGGNKVRSLEFLLAGAARDIVFVTAGARGSTHCLATAVHAAALSRQSVLAHFPQPETEASAAVSAAAERAATRVILARSRAGLPVAVLKAWITARRLGHPRWVPAGGASPAGVVGHLLAGLELAEPMPDPPEAIVVPLGSGGTAAGLALAVAALGWPTRVVAARVAPRIVANGWRVRALARGAALVLERHGTPVPTELSALVVIDALGPGYGWASLPGEVARVTALAHGLRLEPTYGAKAFATLDAVRALGFRRVVFWHTFAFPHQPKPAPRSGAAVGPDHSA